MLYVLDTDHISLFQRGHKQVIAQLMQVPMQNRAVTVVSLSEQVQGWLAIIRRARSESQASNGFQRLHETVLFYQTVTALTYDDEAVRYFEQWRKQGIRIGTQDLRIAAITQHYQATLVTRNMQDFKKVPNLLLADWSL